MLRHSLYNVQIVDLFHTVLIVTLKQKFTYQCLLTLRMAYCDQYTTSPLRDGSRWKQMSEESNNNMKLQTAGELWPDSIKNLKLCNVFTHLLKEW